MLDYSNSNEFQKDFFIFLFNPCLGRETSIIKTMNMLITTMIDYIIDHYEKTENLTIWLNRLDRIGKFFLIVSENTRDKIV